MAPLFEFPKSFLWGAATASHQVEGDNHWNDWWFHEQNGDLPHRSGSACRHYDLYRQDFDLARSLGHNAHRLSIEWSRIEPEEGAWDADALAHYADVVASLRERNIEPFVTLHHFTNPLWFSKSGGWLRRDSVRLFARYVSRVAENIGDVRYWVTINEPTVYMKNGYVVGVWPPFHKGKPLESARLMLRFAHAHVAAYKVLHDARNDACVGFAHSAPYIVPCGHGDWRDKLAAKGRDTVLNDLFFWLVRSASAITGGRCALDFIGLNYYTRSIVRSAPGAMGRLFGLECREWHHNDLGVANELGWQVYAPGLYEVARKFSAFGVPLIVTENGFASTDDSQRADFIQRHIGQLANALKDKIDVRGYFYWTLMDNYEWAHGTTAHFGLAEVDARTNARIPRPSSAMFAGICRANAVDETEPNPDLGSPTARPVENGSP